MINSQIHIINEKLNYFENEIKEIEEKLLNMNSSVRAGFVKYSSFDHIKKDLYYIDSLISGIYEEYEIKGAWANLESIHQNHKFTFSGADELDYDFQFLRAIKDWMYKSQNYLNILNKIKKQNITDLSIDDINREIDQIVNFEGSGGGYGCSEAREADERKLKVLLELRNQKVNSSENTQNKKQNHNSIINEDFVDSSRIEELKKLQSSYDPKKLIKLCEELNICYSHGAFLAVSMLSRSILDHIPPLFNCKNFQEVANNYGGKSFKNSMLHLQNSLRNIADSNLHLQIREAESLPNKVQIDFRNGLDVLLSEIIRISNN